MPLASSREASQKRAERVAKEKKEERRRQRMQRMSLPSTIDSSTSVNEAKVQRRLSARRNSFAKLNVQTKENASPNHPPKSPGPTPYWQVAKERGGPSPPQTRSQKKKKLPPRSQNGVSVELNFSPPNQQENARREREEIARKEEERKQRVKQARKNGQFLVFSPTHRDPSPEEVQDQSQEKSDDELCMDHSPPDSEPTPTGKEIALEHDSVQNSTLSDSHNKTAAFDQEILNNQFKSLRESMQNAFQENVDKLMQAQASAGATDVEKLQQATAMVAKFQTKAELLATENEKLEKTMEKLQADLAEANSKLSTDKEKYLVETTCLQSQLEASGRESERRIGELEVNYTKLQEQHAQLEQDRASLVQKVADREREVAGARSQLEQSKAIAEALRKDNESEKETLALESQRLDEINTNLRKELDSVKKARVDQEAKLQVYQRQVDELENHVLPEKESQLKEMHEMLCSKEAAVSELQEKLVEYESVIQDLKDEVSELNRENEEQRHSFQELNEDSSKAFERLAREATEKDHKIGELFKQLGDTQTQLDEEQKAKQEVDDQLHTMKEELETQIAQLNTALEEAMTQLDESDVEKKTLQRKLAEALEQAKTAEAQAQKAEAAKTEALSKNSALEETLAGVRQSSQTFEKDLSAGREREQKWAEEARMKDDHIFKIERELKATVQERDDAQNHMEGFNDREQELYRRLRESDRMRRELHGRVMQLMGNIRVFVRVRPPLLGEVEKEAAAAQQVAVSDTKKRKRHEKKDGETLFRFPGIYDRESKKTTGSTSSDDLTKNIIELTEPYKDRGGLSERRKKWRYGFDNVFSPEHGQEDVWDATEPLIQSAVDGYNVTIFAYGQTGSGKTYTMLGGDGNTGIIGRSVKKLFDNKRELEALSRGETEVAVSVELLEVYNEQVRDLLAPNSGPNGREIPLKVTSQEVVGNIVVETSTEEEVMKVMALAQKRRCVKATSSNAESSRSHMIMTIHFSVTMTDGMKRTGKLNVCDLAGSERLNKSGAHTTGGALLEETKNINKSLSVLSNVIERLQAGDPNVPFRESKLTFLLRNSLGGNSKTLAIVCCNPLTSHFHESLCSLRFAEKVNKVDLKKAVANFSC